MIRVVAAIMEDRGRLLICQRRRGASFPGQWEFPGGKMKPSETPRQALVRELREELGIEARIGREIYVVRHLYSGATDGRAPGAAVGAKGGTRNAAPGDSAGGIGTDVEVRFFQAQAVFGRPRNVGFECILWVRRGDLPHYGFLAGDREVVSRLGRGEFL